MAWLEEESGVKFIAWGKLSSEQKQKANDYLLIKENEPVEALVMRLSMIEKKDKDNKTVFDYKYRLKVKDVDKEVIMWSNANIKRAQENLKIMEGERIRITYCGDYKTKFGKNGRNVKIEVDRPKK